MSKGRSPLQVTLKSLVFSATTIGAGVGCYMAVWNWQPRHDYADWLGIAKAVWPGVQFLAAGPLIGAGILKPFTRARLGAYVGFFLPIFAIFGYVAYRFGWRSAVDEPVFWQVCALTIFAIAVTICGFVYRTRQRRRQGAEKGTSLTAFASNFAGEH